MAITNGYCTLAEFRAYGTIDSVNATDDTVIEDLIEAVSRDIDHLTGRTFYARAETRYFDAVEGRELWLDDDLISVTTLTNGDTEVLTVTDYYLYPRNTTRKYLVVLKESSTKYWSWDASGNTEGVISLNGSWGYSATTPDDVKTACMETVKMRYSRRSGQNTEGNASITGAGVVITPSGEFPKGVYDSLQHYRKVV